MADQVDFNFNFGAHKDWQPYAGEGGSDVFPFDGFVAVKITALKPYFTKDKKYPAVKVSGVAQDNDAGGLRLMDDVMCGGKDKNGGDLGRQFLELLHSSGTTKDAIQANAAKEVSGSINAIAGQLVNRVAYAEIEADVYEGKETTKVRNWITKERYDQAAAIGAHRRKRRGVANASPAVPSSGLGGAANGTQPAAATAAGGALPLL